VQEQIAPKGVAVRLHAKQLHPMGSSVSEHTACLGCMTLPPADAMSSRACSACRCNGTGTAHATVALKSERLQAPTVMPCSALPLHWKLRTSRRDGSTAF
jgi:hypothetical protein